MITNGFVAGYSDYATLDAALPFTSSYIGAEVSGDIVYENNLGLAQFIPAALVVVGALIPIGAKKILSSGTVNGTPRTTTATGVVYFSGNTP